MQHQLSDNSGVKLEINNRQKARKSPNTWRLNNTLVNNTSQIRNLKRNLKIYFNEMKMQFIKICGMQRKECLEGNL